MSSALSGTRARWKYSHEPQTKKPMQTKNGMTIQVISRAFGGSCSCATSFCGVRRYLIAKKKMTQKVSTDTPPQMMQSVMNSVSTSLANVDASVGNSGKSASI